MVERLFVVVVIRGDAAQTITKAQQGVVHMGLVAVNPVEIKCAVIEYFTREDAFQLSVVVQRLKRPVGVVIADDKPAADEFCNKIIDAFHVLIGRFGENRLFIPVV